MASYILKLQIKFIKLLINLPKINLPTVDQKKLMVRLMINRLNTKVNAVKNY